MTRILPLAATLLLLPGAALAQPDDIIAGVALVTTTIICDAPEPAAEMAVEVGSGRKTGAVRYLAMPSTIIPGVTVCGYGQVAFVPIEVIGSVGDIPTNGGETKPGFILKVHAIGRPDIVFYAVMSGRLVGGPSDEPTRFERDL